MSNGKTICTVCNYIYDESLGEPRQNLAPAVRFEDLPEKWRCPECGSNKDMFQPCSCVSLSIYEQTCVPHAKTKQAVTALTRGFTKETSVGEIVAKYPGYACLFEQSGIDYCCGGKATLAEACQRKGLDVDAFIKKLDLASSENVNGEQDWTRASLKDLTEHLLVAYHDPLRLELSRIQALTEKVAQTHGRRHPEMIEVEELFARFKEEQELHMQKEELILFPSVCAVESKKGRYTGCGNGLEQPIAMMTKEHDEASADLCRMRHLTNSFTQPADACNTFKALLYSLAQLESDMHQHVHKENNILFPRALHLFNAVTNESQSTAEAV
jgi:regulator of cell morphogenesis and NO signaling